MRFWRDCERFLSFRFPWLLPWVMVSWGTAERRELASWIETKTKHTHKKKNAAFDVKERAAKRGASVYPAYTTGPNCFKELIGSGVKSDSCLWLDWSWWITWGAACGNVSVERRWEHGQQSGSLRQSTRCSVVNLNVRGLTQRQKVFLWASQLCCRRRSLTVIHQPLSMSGLRVSASSAPLSPRRRHVQCCWREQRRWPLSCERGAPQQLALITPNCPAGRITSSAWWSKVMLIPLGQASLALGDFFPFFF